MTLHLYAAEAVLPGHPDKLCDACADALVQEACRRDRLARCAVEVVLRGSRVLVSGTIAYAGDTVLPGHPERLCDGIDVSEIVRAVFASAGRGASAGLAPEDLDITSDLSSPEGEKPPVEQSVSVGYAVDLPGTNYLPPERWLAGRLTRRLHELRLGPAGKVLVVLEEGEESYRLVAVSVSLGRVEGAEANLQRSVRALIQAEVQEAVWRLPGFSPQVPEEVHIVTGSFIDTGQSGRQVVANAYGPRVACGGGALSGRDFGTAERGGAILARRLAKAVVLTGAARVCTATLVCIPGQENARLLALCAEEGRMLPVNRWSALVDLSLSGCRERWSRRTDLIEVARHGHFSDASLPWEVIHLDTALPK